MATVPGASAGRFRQRPQGERVGCPGSPRARTARAGGEQGRRRGRCPRWSRPRPGSTAGAPCSRPPRLGEEGRIGGVVDGHQPRTHEEQGLGVRGWRGRSRRPDHRGSPGARRARRPAPASRRRARVDGSRRTAPADGEIRVPPNRTRVDAAHEGRRTERPWASNDASRTSTVSVLWSGASLVWRSERDRPGRATSASRTRSTNVVSFSRLTTWSSTSRKRAIAVHRAAPPGAPHALGGTEALGEEDVVAEVAGVQLVEEEVIQEAALGALEVVEAFPWRARAGGTGAGSRRPRILRRAGRRRPAAAAEVLEHAAVGREVGGGHEVAVEGLDVAEQAGVARGGGDEGQAAEGGQVAVGVLGAPRSEERGDVARRFEVAPVAGRRGEQGEALGELGEADESHRPLAGQAWGHLGGGARLAHSREEIAEAPCSRQGFAIARGLDVLEEPHEEAAVSPEQRHVPGADLPGVEPQRRRRRSGRPRVAASGCRGPGAAGRGLREAGGPGRRGSDRTGRR